MTSLKIEDLPEHIYQKLLQEAESKHRTLAQQAIVTLADGLKTPVDPKMRRKNILHELKSNAEIISKYKLSNPVELIKKDRER